MNWLIERIPFVVMFAGFTCTTYGFATGSWRTFVVGAVILLLIWRLGA